MLENNQKIITRPPIVVVLGHVDSGKTSILDCIRKTHVAEREAGGITQHIGAYQIEHQGKLITFIDTPGHEAFSQMRSRGAKVADIAILVVDVVEGVKEQTKEALSHIKLAQIPMIVALNKMDRPGADPEKVKRELSKGEVLVESLGGKIPSVEISAKTGQKINDLLDLILLVAEIEDFKTDLESSAEGVVVEAYLDKLKGPLATLLISKGILKKNDILTTKSTFGKVKNLENFKGENIDEAFPAMPVLVLGFEKVPRVGEKFKKFEDLEIAKAYVAKSAKKEKQGEVFVITPERKVLNLILKTDCLGTLEAIKESLKNFSQEKVILRIIKGEVGDINESDIKLAQSSKGQIIGFRVKLDKVAKVLSSNLKIKIKIFEVIYELFQEIKRTMEKIFEPEIIRQDLGKVKVLVIFWTEKRRQIVGGRVIEGKVERGSKIEIFREEQKIGQGKMINLQVKKKDVEVVEKGNECGILYEGDDKIQEGDILLFFKKTHSAKTSPE